MGNRPNSALPGRFRHLLLLGVFAVCLLALLPVKASAETTTVYRFWNSATGAHFYTASAEERDIVIARWPGIFKLEGVAYSIESSIATEPLYRFYNVHNGTHFYTASADERDMVKARWPGIYQYEGVAYSVAPSPVDGAVPVYRFYNFSRGVHFYTASADERDMVKARWPGIYHYEGVAFYVTSATATERTPVVCIDPGHQLHANLAPEPIGPGSAVTKPKVAGGTTGVVTRIPEYRFTLTLSLKLKARLEARGVRVVMIRTTDDVNISNAERAQIANAAGADLFVRIHADGSSDSSMHGISTLYPAGNAWVAPIQPSSLRAAQLAQASAVAATGAANRGLSARSDMAGFNWSTVPTFLVECGFMTNPSEDRLLASDAYQGLLAEGIANGIMQYLGE
ncbi:MAG: N-acetylmuramoyl-L-alanine amidase [Coriobacteriia bacterium]